MLLYSSTNCPRVSEDAVKSNQKIIIKTIIAGAAAVSEPEANERR